MLSKILPGIVCLASLGQAVRAQDAPVADDSFFYGQSEAVFPTPEMMETGPWADAVTKAKGLVSQMSLEEKVNLTGGVTSTTGCSGFIAPIPRLGFPGMCLADAGQGVRQTDYVHAWPAAMHVGASFNKELARKRAHFIGGEAKAKGVNSLLGPCIGPLGRHPIGGRNWESFSNDPYLDGKIVFETVTGIQAEGVIATTKHFVGQEQETHRLPTSSTPMVEAVSSNIDDKAMHEAYMWPFYDAVKAGTGSIMCSYNRLNNSYACQNSKAQNGLLKGELGFQGWVVSDWGAQRTGVASALGGLDVAMPSGQAHWGGNLTLAVNNGTIDESTVDNMVTRVLASWFQMKQDTNHPEPGVGMPRDLSLPHKIVDARNVSAKSTLFEGAVEGHVLVKNTDGALPLDGSNMKLISLFGYSAKAPDANNYAKPAPGARFAAWGMGASSGNIEEMNIGFFGNLSYGPYASTSRNGTIISGGGSGATAQNLISAPYDALVAQAHEDGTALFWDFESGAPLVNPMSDACLVIGNAWATEGYDRPELRDDFTDGLILNVADQCANTIVVFHNAGVRLVDQFIDHPNVTAVIFAHLPGQESGRALVSLLYGRSNPSGRLPYTVARNESDYGAVVRADDFPTRAKYALFPQADFKEGVFIDYKDFDARNVTPRYEFGFGLSYTTFAYADVRAAATDLARGELPVGAVAEGGQTDLWDVVATVTARVRNTGARDGREVAQLYIGIPGAGQPARQLRGFEKPLVAAGAEVEVEFPLTRRDLSTWDVAAQKWRLQRGDYQIYVGSSSRNLPLKTTLTLEE